MTNNLSFVIEDAYLCSVYAETMPKCFAQIVFKDKDSKEAVSKKISFTSPEEVRKFITEDLYLGGRYRVEGKYKMAEDYTCVVDSESLAYQRLIRID